MAGRVDELDLELADGDDVAGVVANQIGFGHPRRTGHPRDLVALDMDRARDVFEQPGDAGDLEPHDRATDVVGVVVRRQHTRDRHPVGGDGVDEAGRVVGGIDQHTVAGRPVADRVHEVDHLRRHLVADREVASGEQLSEVQAVVGGLGHDVSVRFGSVANTSGPNVARRPIEPLVVAGGRTTDRLRRRPGGGGVARAGATPSPWATG